MRFHNGILLYLNSPMWLLIVIGACYLHPLVVDDRLVTDLALQIDLVQ